MYFCPNCSNVFDITRTAKQEGGMMNFEGLETISSSISSSGSDDDIMIGGKLDIYDDIIDRFINHNTVESNEIEKLSLDELVKSIAYKKLKHNQREYVYNKFQDLIPLKNKKVMKEESLKQTIDKAYFICNNCGYLKPIMEGTLIFSQVSSDVAQSYSASDTKDMKHSDILPRTRKYLCPNTKCESHIDLNKREASFFRMNNMFKIKYICQTCGTMF